MVAGHHSGRICEFHGHAKGGDRHPLYWTWTNIKKRCYYSRHRYYHLYGGRGIKVCDRWLRSFSNFLADVGERPAPGYSLDRINNDGDYEPGNVAWATPTQQSRNSKNAKLTLEKTKLIREDYGRGNVSKIALGRKFNVSDTAIYEVVTGRSWKD